LRSHCGGATSVAGASIARRLSWSKFYDHGTTRVYDRSRHNLDRHPTYTMAAQLRRSAHDTNSVAGNDSEFT
jgi:hypothetical protein